MLSVLNANSEKILQKRYYLEGEDWPALCARITDNVVPGSCKLYGVDDNKAKDLTKDCFDLINNLYFLPNSPTMFNAGTKYPMLSACFIIDIEDDLASIYETVKESALIHKMGGGVGLCFGKLRGNGSTIATTHGKSRGAVSFLKVCSHGTEEITAAGKRKGANMAQLPVWHCDIEEYIDCKAVEGDISNFNITVQLTDEFVNCVDKDLDFDLYDPKDMRVVRTVKARYLMDKIVAGAKRNGEPGICFIDRINRDNPTPHLGKITSANPCGEFYSIPYNSCNLGSLNLTKYVIDGKFDWGLFEKHIRLATLYLDCIIDSNMYPLDKIDKVSKSTRPLGLGVMGFADALILLGIKYDSEQGFEFAERISEFLSYISLDASVDLAKIRGVYPEYRSENHQYSKYKAIGKLDWEKLIKKGNKYGFRNSHTVVIAPTGTIATLANEVSHGIEPLFGIVYERHIMNTTQYGNHWLYDMFLNGDLTVSEGVFITAKDISWIDHIEMQSRWQKFTHNGISKTINMPSGATEEDVYNAFMLAHTKGLKGITVYIDGSRKNEVIVSSGGRLKYNPAPKRPNELVCDIHHIQVQGAKWVTFVGLLDDRPYEIFAGLSKYVDLPKKYEKGIIVKRPYKTKPSEYDLVINMGTDDELKVRNIVETFSNDNESVLGRLVSLSLRHGTRPAHLSDQLLKDPSDDFMTYAKCLGRILKKYISDGEKPETGTRCPECGADLIYQEGCKSCSSCGFAKCG